MSRKRSVAKYGLASVATVLYAGSALTSYTEKLAGKFPPDKDIRKLYAAAGGMTVLTWLIAAL